MSEATMFREEAMEALEAPQQHGAPLHLLPGWTKGAYWFVLAVVLGTIVYCSLAFVSDYAEGPAVVRVDGRLDLTTSTGGTAMEVLVHQGDHVRDNQLLVRFYSGFEQQELDHTEREFKLTLVRLLQDPTNEGARQALASLRAQRELSKDRIRTRSVFAPKAGVVGSVRVRPGQSTAQGEVVATLVDDSARAYSVVALVPGQFRPMLKVGQPLRFELEGYPHVYARLPVESIGDEAVGPNEVRRYLGEEVADTMPVQGSLIVVRARLKERTFVYDGKSYRYYDGIPGRVDVNVRSTRLILMLFPMLREVFDHGSRK